MLAICDASMFLPVGTSKDKIKKKTGTGKLAL